MVKIITKTNCGNSPKMSLIEQLNIAFVKGNTKFIAQHVTDDVIWNIPGVKTIMGKEKLTQELEKMATVEAIELTLDQILSHGKQGAVSGIITMQDKKQFAFSDFYQFKGAKDIKITKIVSHVVEI